MIPSLVNGLLPLGRFGATLPEIEASFVAGPEWVRSTTRSSVWADWQQITSDVRSVVPVCAVWVGGSFFTDKLDPDDLDAVYIIDSRELATVQANPVLGLLAKGSLIRSITGQRVDTYVMTWVPDPDGQGQQPGFNDYAGWRGYWDDLWQRKIEGAKNAQRVSADALPKRGYLEVTLDGYTA